MKKIAVVFTVEVTFSVPDNFCDLVRKEQKEMGEQHLPPNPTDEDIYQRVAWARGIAKLPYDESMTEELENLVTDLETEEEYESWRRQN